MASPIGALMAESLLKAVKKTTSQHTSEAPCGCRVSTSLPEKGHTGCQVIDIDRCPEHAYRRDEKGKRTDG